MKKLLLLIPALSIILLSEAQLLKKIKDKANNTVDKKVDETMNGKKDESSTSENNIPTSRLH